MISDGTYSTKILVWSHGTLQILLCGCDQTNVLILVCGEIFTEPPHVRLLALAF